MKFCRFEKRDDIINITDNYIKINCDLIINKSSYNLEFKIFNYTFELNKKENCGLIEYHRGYDTNCQYIGFFGSEANELQIDHYGALGRIPYVLDLEFVYTNPYKKQIHIGKINSDATYGTYDKNSYFFISKLEWEREKKYVGRMINGEWEQLDEYIESGHNRVVDEYIVIANTTIPIYTIKFLKYQTPSSIYDFIKNIFLLELSGEHIKFKNISINKEKYHGVNFNVFGSDVPYKITENYNDDIDCNLFRSIIKYIQYKLYEQIPKSDGKIEITTVINDVEPMQQGGYYEKYLKYKQKYIELKNKLL